MTVIQKVTSFFSSLPTPRTRIDGWKILITGANTGLGFEAAKHFARQGASVILACRSRERALEAKSRIDALLNLAPDVVQVSLVDMASFESVRDLAGSVGPVDGVVLNAGVMSGRWDVTGDGWEQTLQVNVLGTALLGRLLLPRTLERGKEIAASGGVRIPTISIVSSRMFEFAEVERYAKIEGNIVRALNDEENFGMGESDLMTPRRYSMSKLLDVYIARELAALVPKSSDGSPMVIVNCVAPGFCHSDLMREYNLPLLGLSKALFARSTEVGARTYFHSIVDAGPGSHGEFVDNCKIQSLPENFFKSEKARALQGKVWDDVMEILEDVVPEVKRGHAGLGGSRINL